jgi:hypothetical protein
MPTWATFDEFLRDEQAHSPSGRVVITRLLEDLSTPWHLAPPVASVKGRDARRRWLKERVNVLFPPAAGLTVELLLRERLRVCDAADLPFIMRALDADREAAFQAAETERHRLDMERARHEAAAEQARTQRRLRRRIQCCYVVFGHPYLQPGHFPTHARKVAPIFGQQIPSLAADSDL